MREIQHGRNDVKVSDDTDYRVQKKKNFINHHTRFLIAKTVSDDILD